jgi:enterobactin synthetase component D
MIMSPHLDGTASAPKLAPVALGLELPPDVRAVALSLGPPEHLLELLSGFEPEGVPRGAAPKRRAEFLAGRHAATLALERLGQRAPVGRNLDGTPAWPSGVTGSISHGGGIACAAVAARRNYQSLGLDVERILLDRDGPEVAPTVARSDELLLLKTALPHARLGERLTLIFSCKESLFKCLFPLTRQFMEFEDARVVGLGQRGRGMGSVTLRLERSVSPDFPAGHTLDADFYLGSERVESAVFLKSLRSRPA